LGVLSDPSGKLMMPGIGSIFYVATVIGVAVFLAYKDRKGDPSDKKCKFGQGYKGRRGTTAR
jgi:hypothetical protein